MPVSSMTRPTGPRGGMTSRSCTPVPTACRWACSRFRRPAESQKRVVVRSAITTATPGLNAAVIRARTSPALVSPGPRPWLPRGDHRPDQSTVSDFGGVLLGEDAELEHGVGGALHAFVIDRADREAGQ